MLDFTTIPSHVITARGQYSTVRSAHEDALKGLQQKIGSLMALSSQILKQMQPDSGIPLSADEQFKDARRMLDEIEQVTINIRQLAEQREDLKPLAWGRKQ